MFRIRDLHIKHKLIAIQLTTACIVLLFFGLFAFLNDLRTFRNSVVSQLTSTANLIGGNSVSALDFADSAAAEKVLSSLDAEPDIVGARIYDALGRVFATYPRSGFPDPGAALPEGEAPEFSGGRVLISRKIALGGETLGSLLLISDMKRYRRAVAQNAVLALSLLLVGVVAAFLLSMLTQKAISEPILRLVDAAKGISETGKYSFRVEKQGSDEIGMLCETFNDMIAQVEKREASLQEAHAVLEERVKERTAQLAVAKEAAESADRLKSAFLATMSHELRTPLNSIIGFTGILLQELPGPLNEEQKKQLGMSKGSAEHLLELINDVLDISKIEAGQLQVVVEPFDLRAAVQKTILAARPLADKKGLALEADIAPEVGTIAGDRRRVEQVLLNLLSNAIKFTDRGRVRTECSLRAGQVSIRVTDTGIGMRKEDMADLFKPFRQIDAGISRQYEGTGLGLSICKKLVELMDGSIRAESALGAGSTFSVAFPADRKAS
ncbi:MAG: ATP-binding protein [Elusimicrobiota bacterium]